MSNPSNRNKQVTKQTTTVSQQKFYIGAIPSPEMMEHFAEIDPLLPGRIMTMAENEGDARRAREREIVKKSFALDIFSTSLGFLSVLGVIWLCYQFIMKGYATEGAYVACGVIVSLAVIFVLRRRPPANKKQPNH